MVIRDEKGLCTRDVGPPDDSRSWQFSVDWTLYKLYNRSTKELSSPWALRQRQETQKEGQMQSRLEVALVA